jgi:hypothetical protein
MAALAPAMMPRFMVLQGIRKPASVQFLFE